MVELIKKLLKKGLAYKGEDNSIYFSIKKFKNYGKLSGFKIKELKAGARVKQDEYEKENARDFALWKAYSKDDGNVFWETELGKGRPGWHIECSAMSIKHLGNFYTLRDLLEKNHTPETIRFLLISTHYRSEINFTEKTLEEAKIIVQKFNELILKLKEIKNENGVAVDELIKKANNSFQKALDDDLNISLALTSLIDFMKEVNKLIDEEKLSKKAAIQILSFLKQIDSVLGVMNFEEEKIEKKLINLIQEREKARKEKNWKKADEIRDLLLKKGIQLDDTKDGVRWKKN